jgi:hypothetical protein
MVIKLNHTNKAQCGSPAIPISANGFRIVNGGIATPHSHPWFTTLLKLNRFLFVFEFLFSLRNDQADFAYYEQRSRTLWRICDLESMGS